VKGELSFPWLEKTAPIMKPVEDNICPDKKSKCPDGSTCCVLSTGDYGCCPLPKAVCCTDKLHCCPEGTTCDVPHSKCNKGDITFPWMEKTAAKQIEVDSVKCLDGSSCPDGSTCCKLSTGQYGCCPLPNAVCCSDGLHCCPSGYKCDVSAGSCLKGDEAMPWVEKFSAIPPKVSPILHMALS